MVTIPLEVRFWEKVQKGDGCWEWTASLQKERGYGQINIDRRPHVAHRISWTLTNGKIPDGMCVLHKCDNRKCVRPNHLFLGTNKDNTLDMLAKGRQANGCLITRGENVHTASLTEAQIPEIRSAAAAGETQRSIAKRYGVRQSAIWMIIHRRSWAHVP